MGGPVSAVGGGTVVKGNADGGAKFFPSGPSVEKDLTTRKGFHQ